MSEWRGLGGKGAEGYKVDLTSHGILEIPRFCGKLFMKNAKEHTDSPLWKDEKPGGGQGLHWYFKMDYCEQKENVQKIS